MSRSVLSAVMSRALNPTETYAWELTERYSPGFARAVFALDTGAYVLISPSGVFWLAALISDRALQGFGDARSEGYVFTPTAGPFNDREMLIQTGLPGWDVVRREVLMESGSCRPAGPGRAA